MKKIIAGLLFVFTFLLITSDTFALSCSSSESPVCITSKSDFYKKSMGKFKYLDWTHTIEDKALFLGNTTNLEFNGKFESVGYTIKNEDTVNYYVSLFDFTNEQTALELFTKKVLDSNYKTHKNSEGTVYQLKDANSESLLWIHNNIMVSLHTNPNAPKKKDFFKKAFTIYSKKIKPELLDGLKTDYPISTITPLPLPPKKDLSMDLKVNGSDTSISLKSNTTLDITWTSTGTDKCEASGNFIPKKDKSGVWGLVNNDLPTNGSMQLLASGYSNKKNTYLPTLRIEVLCSNNTGNKNFSQVRDSVVVYVNK